MAHLRGLRFRDAVTDRVNFGNGAGIDNLAAADSVSWCGWVMRTSEAGFSHFLWSSDPTFDDRGGFMIRGLPDGVLNAIVYRVITDANVESATGVIPLNRLVFLAVVFDSGASQSIRIYTGLPGEPAREVAYGDVVNGDGAARNDAGNDKWLGNNQTDTNSPWGGSIFGFGVHRRALSLPDIHRVQRDLGAAILGDTRGHARMRGDSGWALWALCNTAGAIPDLATGTFPGTQTGTTINTSSAAALVRSTRPVNDYIALNEVSGGSEGAARYYYNRMMGV